MGLLAGVALPSASASIVFSDNFDLQPDWTSKQQTTGGIGWGLTFEGTCTTHCPPPGWTSYRAGPSLWAPNLRDTYLINGEGARGGSGKGLTYNVESSGEWGTWAGGAIDKYLGPVGHKELYVRFWLKESAEFCWGSEELNLNALGKFLRITALRRDPTVNPRLFNPQLYPSPETSPNFIPDAYRRFQPNYGIPAQFNASERYAPNYQTGPTTTFPSQLPNDSATGGKGYCGDNKWHSYEFYVKLNSALDAPDGAYRIWLDGKLVGEKTNIPWVKSGTDSNGTPMSMATGWNWVMLADNIDSTAYPKSEMKEMSRYLDDVVISTHYSGPPAAPVNVTAAPATSAVTLQWARGTNGASYQVDGYHVYYGTDPANLTSKLTVGNVTQVQIPNLAATKYYFAVAGFHKAGSGNNENEGLRSSVISATVSGATATPADTSAPVATIVTPAAGSTLSGTATINVSASDNVAVSKVEVYLNGALLGVMNAAPYSLPWNTANNPNGAYTVMVKAYDAAGNAGSKSVSVSVNNAPVSTADTIAPTVKVTSPAYGSTVKGIATITATASDNVGVRRVDFFVNGVLKGSDATAPFTFNWDTKPYANAAYTVGAKAYDAAGNVGTYKGITLYVSNDLTPPVITLTSPSGSYIYSATLTMNGAATDNVGVTKMQVYLDGILLFTTTNSYFSLSRTVVKGNHTIMVKAYDAANNVRTLTRTVNRVS